MNLVLHVIIISGTITTLFPRIVLTYHLADFLSSFSFVTSRCYEAIHNNQYFANKWQNTNFSLSGNILLPIEFL